MSKIYLEQRDLLQGVQKAYPITTDNTLESFNTFQLKLVDDLLFIASTDSETTFITSIPVTLEDISVTEIVVNSNYFLNIVKNLPDNKEVTFIITEDSLIINCESFETVIQAYEGEQAELHTGVVDISEEEYDDVIESSKLSLIVDGLLPIVQRAEGLDVPAIIIHENLAYATDNHVVSTVRLKHNRSYAIPIKVAQCISSILKNNQADNVYLKYIEDDSAVLVKVGEDIFYFRCLLVDFDDFSLSNFIDEAKSMTSIFSLEKTLILKLLNRISAGKLVRNVELEISKDLKAEQKAEVDQTTIRFKCMDSIINSHEKITTIGKNIISKRFIVDYDGLTQIIRQIQTKDFTVRYNQESDRLVVVSADREMISFIASME